MVDVGVGSDWLYWLLAVVADPATWRVVGAWSGVGRSSGQICFAAVVLVGLVLVLPLSPHPFH